MHFFRTKSFYWLFIVILSTSESYCFQPIQTQWEEYEINLVEENSNKVINVKFLEKLEEETKPVIRWFYPYKLTTYGQFRHCTKLRRNTKNVFAQENYTDCEYLNEEKSFLDMKGMASYRRELQRAARGLEFANFIILSGFTRGIGSLFKGLFGKALLAQSKKFVIASTSTILKGFVGGVVIIVLERLLDPFGSDLAHNEAAKYFVTDGDYFSERMGEPFDQRDSISDTFDALRSAYRYTFDQWHWDKPNSCFKGALCQEFNVMNRAFTDLALKGGALF